MVTLAEMPKYEEYIRSVLNGMASWRNSVNWKPVFASNMLLISIQKGKKDYQAIDV